MRMRHLLFLALLAFAALARAELTYAVEVSGPDNSLRYSGSYASAMRVGGHAYYYDDASGPITGGGPAFFPNGVYAGLATPCLFCQTPEARAYGDFDGSTGRFRAVVGVVAAANDFYDAYAAGSLSDLIDPGTVHLQGALMRFSLDLEAQHSILDNQAGGSIGGTGFAYHLRLQLPESAAPANCGGEGGPSCDTSFAEFVYTASRDGFSGQTSWNWSLTLNQNELNALFDSGTGNHTLVAFDVPKPFQPFELSAGGSASAYCNTALSVDIPCRATVDAMHSVYLAIDGGAGGFSSASGFRYLDRAQVAAIPESATVALWLLGLLALAWRLRRGPLSLSVNSCA